MRRSLHRALVPIPLGCWAAGFVLEVVTRFLDEPGWANAAATRLVGYGLLAALVTAVAGLAAAVRVPPESPAGSLALAHLCAAFAAVATWFGVWITRSTTLDQPTTWSAVAAGLAAVLVTAGAAWLGHAICRRGTEHS